MINRLAGQSLPTDVPAFLRSPAALDSLSYYAPLPDHWRSPAAPQLTAATAAEHYIQIETVDAFVPTLPRNRYDFVRALAVAQAVHLDLVITAEKTGLQPYPATEVYQRLMVGMRDYRQLFAAKEDTRPVEAEIIFLAGWLGHYVGDGSMPLHTSKYSNGWTGSNPHQYNDGHNIHGLFESEFVHANVKPADISPLIAATPVVVQDVFTQYVSYLRQTHTHVEEIYQLDKKGAFTGVGTAEGKALVDHQLAAAVMELRNLIYTAWIHSGEPLPGRQLS